MFLNVSFMLNWILFLDCPESWVGDGLASKRAKSCLYLKVAPNLEGKKLNQIKIKQLYQRMSIQQTDPHV